MSLKIEFVYDYASPYSYLAAFRFRGFLSDLDVDLVHLPVYLRGFELFKEKMPFPPRKLVYMMKDLERWADLQEVPFKIPKSFPVNGLYALRGDIAARKMGVHAPYFVRLFKAAWAEGGDIGDPETVISLAAEAGLEEKEFRRRLASDAVKEKLRKNTTYAESKGVFGVPTFFVEDEMFWGNDRLDFVRREAERLLGG